MNPDLVHSQVLQRLDAATPKTWEENLVQADELGPLRADADRWKAKQPVDVESKSSDSKEKKKKKKKDKKDDEKAAKKKKKKKKKVGGRLIARKKLEDIYGGTGLDPDYKSRRLLVKKTRKRLRKTKASSSSSGSTSSTSSSSLQDGEDHLLEDKSRIQRIASLAPGMLTHQGIQNMKENINQAGGTPWGIEESSIPPICLQYTRQFLAPKASQAMSRELLTLSHLLDCLLQGRIAEAADAATQRLKALEMVQQGQSWSTAGKVELVPGSDPMVSSRPELQIASKEAQLEAKTRNSSWSSNEKGKSKSKGSGKGKEKEKGKTGGKGDAKKGQNS